MEANRWREKTTKQEPFHLATDERARRRGFNPEDKIIGKLTVDITNQKVLNA